MDRHEERMLVELAAAGDRNAASRLIQAHQASLYAYLLRLSGRPDVAEDVVQDAFVRVLTNLDRFDPSYRFSTWLFTIARRLFVNACQKHKPVYDSDVVGGHQSRGHEPAWHVAQDEFQVQARDAIGLALAELSEQQREIVILFHQQDWPIANIADHMGMPEGTVKSHLHRGRRKMRRFFEQNQFAGIEIPAFVTEASEE